MAQKLPSKKNILSHFDERDPVMAGVIRNKGAFKLSLNRNYFLVLCKAIIGQQISTKAAESITQRFKSLFPSQTPTPKKVAVISAIKLRQSGLSGQKVKYLKDLAARFLDGSIRPRRFPLLGNEEVVETLTSVYGIGRWTAEMFLIFSLNRTDILPLGDLGLQAGIKKIYNMRSLPSPKKMLALGKKWHPMETVATWYAWRVQDAEIITY
ncbi:MAG: DNA-3-methyladenine glycosylase 2 family protein [Nitrospina sp.]|jgi:DNA-3-methyladenine glycosylase II|nr:DNA-3-methyladenine glycosylase 2 family protein [Nitrospina sp.]MBT6717499.1 DNA-3-methyladenine glycosylase 2 family protein [Nitrospina sp.]